VTLKRANTNIIILYSIFLYINSGKKMRCYHFHNTNSVLRLVISNCYVI